MSQNGTVYFGICRSRAWQYLPHEQHERTEFGSARRLCETNGGPRSARNVESGSGYVDENGRPTNAASLRRGTWSESVTLPLA